MIKEFVFAGKMIDFLRGLGYKSYRFKGHSLPDYLVVLPDRKVMFIEAKRHTHSGYGATDGQLIKMEKLRKEGHVCLLLHSDDDWKQLIKEGIEEVLHGVGSRRRGTETKMGEESEAGLQGKRIYKTERGGGVHFDASELDYRRERDRLRGQPWPP